MVTIVKYLETPTPVDWPTVMAKLVKDFERTKKEPEAFPAFATEGVREALDRYHGRLLEACAALLWQGYCTIVDNQLGLYQRWTQTDYDGAEDLMYFYGEENAADGELPTPIPALSLEMPASYNLQLINDLIDAANVFSATEKADLKTETRLNWDRHPNRRHDALGWLLCLLPAYLDVGQPDPATYMDYVTKKPTLLDIAPTATKPAPKSRPEPTATRKPPATPQQPLFQF
jgi:hypothetical protein